MITRKEHLELEGLKKILELKSSLNKGLSSDLIKAFPNIKSAIRPIVKLPETLDINWFVGFVDGEGCFYINITKPKANNNYSIQLNFNLTQHIRDVLLFKFIQEWLGFGYIYEIPKDSRVNLVVSKLEDINNIIIKLDQYPLKGIKRLNYEDFKLATELLKKKEHLTIDGLKKIKEIKLGMNTKRKMTNSSVVEDESTLVNKKSTLNIYNVQKRTFHSGVRAINRIGPHDKEIISIIIGSLLGKALANGRTIEGVRFCFRQSLKHKDYLFWLYQFFLVRGYCSNLEPRKYTRALKGKIHYGYEFNTYTFRSLKWIHSMFYKNGIKYINPNIVEYITPLSLAIWIMDDGGLAKPGLRLATNSFTFEEVKLLHNMLTIKFNLGCTIQHLNSIDRQSIYIKGSSITKLKELVLPYVHTSMHYKLGEIAPKNLIY